MTHETLFLDYIPHLREHVTHLAVAEDGVYRMPEEAGCASHLEALRAQRAAV
jgi:L-fuconate dehydratase